MLIPSICPVYLPVRMRRVWNAWSHTEQYENCQLQRGVTNPVAKLSNSSFWGRSLAETAGSNPASNMGVFLLEVLCVVRPLCRADHSPRGVLPTVMCRCVWSRNLMNEETLAHWGLLGHGKYRARGGINWIMKSCELQDWFVPLTQRTMVLYLYIYIYICFYFYIQGVSRLEDVTAGGDYLGLCDQKSSYKHVSDFGRLRSYDRLKLRVESNYYWQ